MTWCWYYTLWAAVAVSCGCDCLQADCCLHGSTMYIFSSYKYTRICWTDSLLLCTCACVTQTLFQIGMIISLKRIDWSPMSRHAIPTTWLTRALQGTSGTTFGRHGGRTEISGNQIKVSFFLEVVQVFSNLLKISEFGFEYHYEMKKSCPNS